jgi:hypothetical protein
MKKIFFSLFVLLAMLAATSCKKDNPVPTLSVLEQKLLGKWTWTQYSDSHIPADLNDVTYDMPGGSYMEFLNANLPDNFIYYDGGFLTKAKWVTFDDTSFIAEINGGPTQLTIQNVTPTSMVLVNTSTSNGIQHIVSFTLTKP